MFCLVGLGNPGTKYHKTRHNAGFMVIDQIIAKIGGSYQNAFESEFVKLNYQGQSLLLVRPQTYMNCSGKAVVQFVNYYKIKLEQLLIIYDDLDLNLGVTRLRLNGSAGGHRGLNSIIEALHTKDIPRLRLGIGRPTNDIAVVDYVLTSFAKDDWEKFSCGVKRAAEAALSFVFDGPQTAMNRYNKEIHTAGN